MANPPLNETLYGLFYDIFKRVGIILDIDKLDALKLVTDRLTTAIQGEIKDGMKKLASVTIQEMQALEEKLSGQKSIEKVKLPEGTSDNSVS